MKFKEFYHMDHYPLVESFLPKDEQREVKVNMAIVKKRDSSPHYLKLVRKTIRDGEGKPLMIAKENGMVALRSWSGYLLGDVWVPEEAVTMNDQT